MSYVTPSEHKYARYAERYVRGLLKYKPNERSEDRRALAELRGILRGQPDDYLRAGKYVIPYLPEDCFLEKDDFVQQCFFQIGGLYAWGQPQISYKNGISLGKALGELLQSGKSSDSLDGRFLTLLSSRPDTLFVHMRQVIGLLRSAGSAKLDWEELLIDVLAWNQEAKRVQFRWAKGYYRDPFDKNQNDELEYIDEAADTQA